MSPAPPSSSPDASLRPPVFICGTGRSGTTILTRALAFHPQIFALRWESQLFSGLPGLVDLVSSEGEVASRTLAQFRQRLMGHLFRRGAPDRQAGLFELVDERRLLALADAFSEALGRAADRAARAQACRQLAEAIFAGPTVQQGAVRWCEKTPRNLICADRIAEILPGAQFLHIVRDGRDVSASILARKFWPIAKSKEYPQTAGFAGPPTFDSVLAYWTTFLDIGQAQEAVFSPEQWLTVRFEDLVSAPQAVLARIFRFLGCSEDAAALQRAAAIFKDGSAHRERWREDFSPEQLCRLEAVARENLVRYGYPLS